MWRTFIHTRYPYEYFIIKNNHYHISTDSSEIIEYIFHIKTKLMHFESLLFSLLCAISECFLHVHSSIMRQGQSS